MVTLRQKVRFLSEPASYPEAPARVEMSETHMSYVFLTGTRALKLKKPVTYPFLDFSTLAARERDCREEVRLNARLAEDVYRDVRALRADAAGRLTFAPRGRIVDWLVEMRQLPGADLLDRRLGAERVKPEDIVAVARKLAQFYHALTPEIADGPLYLDHLSTEMAVNRNILTRRRFDIEGADAVVAEVMRRFAAVGDEIGARIAGGQIVEGHGDLRPQHVFLGHPPLIIDCLEFSRAMRILDPYDELNYLGLECAMLGAHWIRPLLIGSLEEYFGTPPSRDLLGFYGAFRALLRARLCIAHLLDPEPQNAGHWPPLARHYLRMARAELVSPFAGAGEWSRPD